MGQVKLRDVGLDIPVYEYGFRKLSNALLRGRAMKSTKLKTTSLVTALDGINLNLTEGSRLAIVGDNGSGKSSLLRVIAGVYIPTRGSCSVVGSVSSLLDVSLGIEPDLTGRESIYARGDLMGIPRRQLAKLEKEIVEFADIPDAIDLPTRTYSSGMQVRLGFAISTAVAPDILIMDEWLSVGDQGFRLKAQTRLEEMVENTKVLIVATHSRSLVESVCNEVLWLSNGQAKAYGSAESIAVQYFGSD